MFQTISSATVIIPLFLSVAIILPVLMLTRVIRPSTSQLVALIVFIVYGFTVIDVTLFPLRVVPEAMRRDSLIPSSINLTPFAHISETSFILNVIMMIPLGFLLPILLPKLRSLRTVTVAGFLASASIEGMQLFSLLTFGNRRIVDVDDLIANTGGAVIGYGIWFLVIGMAATIASEAQDARDVREDQAQRPQQPTWQP